MQYQWLGQLSEAERERMQRTLRTAAAQFAVEFDTELSRALVSLQVDGPTMRDENWTSYAQRYSAWTNGASEPRLVRDVLLVDTPPGTELPSFEAAGSMPVDRLRASAMEHRRPDLRAGRVDARSRDGPRHRWPRTSSDFKIRTHAARNGPGGRRSRPPRRHDRRSRSATTTRLSRRSRCSSCPTGAGPAEDHHPRLHDRPARSRRDARHAAAVAHRAALSRRRRRGRLPRRRRRSRRSVERWCGSRSRASRRRSWPAPDVTQTLHGGAARSDVHLRARRPRAPIPPQARRRHHRGSAGTGILVGTRDRQVRAARQRRRVDARARRRVAAAA